MRDWSRPHEPDRAVTRRSDAYDVIRHDAIAGIERRRLQPDRQLAEVRAEVERAVDDYQRNARLGDEVPLGDAAAMVHRVLRSITDLGPLTDLLARQDVEEIFIEGARVTYLDSSGRLRGLAEPTAEDENRQILDRLLAVTDRQLNAKHPMVQARVLDGTARLTAAIPPVADCLSATVRRYTVRDVTLDELVARDAITPAAAAFLWALVQQRSRIVISGEPGAGKTTLAAAMLSATPASHCLRCCEEVRELAIPLTHGAYYEVRPAGLDGTGEISLRDLVKFVLAMRPDRIVVGEVRGAEAFELTRAINAGCGFMCTVHANSAPDALNALVNAALMAGENVTEQIVRRVFSQALDVIVHIDRDDASRGSGAVRRQVTEITAVVPSLGAEQTFEPIFVRDGLGRPLEWTGALPPGLEARLDRALPRGSHVRGLLDRSEMIA
jgi:pilus assembly protein CpaF